MLLTYILQDNYCKWVDGWLQNKVYKLPCLFFSPRTPMDHFACRFFFLPLSTWEPFHRLTTAIPTCLEKKKFRASQRTFPFLFKYAVPGLKYIKPLYQSTYTNVKWRAKKKELIKNMKACNHLEAQIGGNLLEEIFPLSGTVQDWSMEVLSPAKILHRWCYLRPSLMTLCGYRPLWYIHTIFFFHCSCKFFFLKSKLQDSSSSLKIMEWTRD